MTDDPRRWPSSPWEPEILLGIQLFFLQVSIDAWGCLQCAIVQANAVPNNAFLYHANLCIVKIL
jgi:hypothetical protein